MTDKDKRFADEYMIDLNATAAALRAGFAPSTAKNAAEWIKEGGRGEKKGLRCLIDRKMADRSKRTGVNADRVLEELAKIAFANPADIIDPETGKIREGARPEDIAAVSAVRIKAGRIEENEVRMADKSRALELLGKHLGMFKDNVQIQGAVPVIVDDDGE